MSTTEWAGEWAGDMIIERLTIVANHRGGVSPARQIARWARGAVVDLRARASRGEPLTPGEIDEVADRLEEAMREIGPQLEEWAEFRP